MKAYSIEMLVLDNEDMGFNEVESLVKNTRYLYPSIINMREAEVKEWSDDHPLNKEDTAVEEYHRLFKLPSKKDLTDILVLLGESLNTDTDSAVDLVIEAADKLRTFL